VTHRGLTTDVAFVTGHEDPTKETSEIQWDKLATAVGTICFYMGVKNLPDIADRLMEHGRAPETPVALVRWGTTPRQETIVGTLADIAAKVEAAGFKAPAITVVGDVVSLRDDLKWFEDRPLFGRTIVVTRSRTQASALAERLLDLGAEVLEFPTIRATEPEDWGPADAAIGSLSGYDWVVFTSTNGVDSFFERLVAHHLDARALAGAQVAAIGPATAARLIDCGVYPDYVPGEYRAEGVLEGFLERGVGKGVRVLIPRALEAREILPDTLRERGAQVDVVPVYRTVVGQGEASVLERLAEGSVDAVTFTSSSTVKNFVKLTESIDLSTAMKDVTVASIGPVTSETAAASDLEVDVEAAEYTIPGLIEALTDHYRKDS